MFIKHIAILIFLFQISIGPGLCAEIILKSGRTIKTKSYWEENNLIKYDKNGMIVGIPKESVNEIVEDKNNSSRNNSTVEFPVKMEKFRNEYNMDFVFIPPGKYIIGSPEVEPGRKANEILHSVFITKGFYIQTTELTILQYKLVMGHPPRNDQASASDSCPITNLLYEDVKLFLNKINYPNARPKYRLPTEAEWEIGCRAGTTTAFSFGDDKFYLDNYGWYNINSRSVAYNVSTASLKPIAQKIPNAFGIFDMHGNVSEICADKFNSTEATLNTYVDGVVDPVGVTGILRAIRGGNYKSLATNCRCAYRAFNSEIHSSWEIGLRLLVEP
jgi:formylglycine-generating enzyme required for sulfatase activity